MTEMDRLNAIAANIATQRNEAQNQVAVLQADLAIARAQLTAANAEIGALREQLGTPAAG